VTGKPAHDRLYPRPKRGEDAAGEVLRRYGLDNGKDTVLYVPSYFKEAKRLLSVYYPCDSEYISMDAILKAMSAFPDKQLIIKLHPFDGVDMKDFIDSKIKRRANTFVIKDADVISLMEASSLVIASLFSSAAMDAVILGKPLITLNIYRREDLVPFFDYGVALRATNSEELEKALRGISEDKDVRDMLASNRERFIKDYAYRMDGNSTGRVMDLIEEMRKDI
jgi:hypothetical protein